jgi:hypothetical protein
MADFTPVELSVQLIPQPTDSSCWAGSMAMVVSTRDSQSVTPDAIAQAAGMTTTDGYGWSDIQKAVSQWRLNELGPACALPAAWADMVRAHGPIWIVEIGAPYHAVVVTGVVGDGTPEGSTILVNNPWPPNSGAQERKPYLDFENEFELGAGANAQMVSA